MTELRGLLSAEEAGLASPGRTSYLNAIAQGTHAYGHPGALA